MCFSFFTVRDELILRYLRTFIHIPDLHIASRWHGIYLKHPTEPYVQADPRPWIISRRMNRRSEG